jgi:hypothetical protein
MVPSAVLKTETFKNLEDRTISKLKVVCSECFESFHFPGVVNRENKEISGMFCPKKECK